MVEPFLQKQLEPVARRLRRYRLLRQLALCWGAGAIVGWSLYALDRSTGIGSHWLFLALFGVLAITALVIRSRSARWQPDYRAIARQIERHNPQLHSLLITAIEQRPDPATGTFHFLQERVIQQAVLESRKQSWVESIPSSRIRAAGFAHGVTLLLLLSLLFVLYTPWNRPLSTGSRAHVAASKTTVTVIPGDASVEKGTPLALLARFEGPLPPDVRLMMNLSANPSSTAAEVVKTLPLIKSLDDPVFATTLTEVTGDFTYHIEYAGQVTREYRVRVFEYPRLDRADAIVSFPSYTHLPEKKIPDTRRVSAVEGAKLQIEFHLNKPVQKASLLSKGGLEIALTPATNTALVRLDSFLFTTNCTFELRLVDFEGRTNKSSAQFVFEALPNRRPDIKIASPKGDQKVSPLEEVHFASENSDDYGLLGYGLAYRIPGSPEQVISVITNSAPNEKLAFSHLLRLEELHQEAGGLVSWYLWADDIGPDGQSRRTTTDMFFAEVRAFEEVFRKAEGGDSEGDSLPPPSQQQSEKLLELQKQIIAATFKLQKQEAGRAAGPFAQDAHVVKESQDKASEMVEGAKAKTQDPKMLGILEDVGAEMEKASKQLGYAADGPSNKPLAPALDSEQAAYQGLLRMQAREFQVQKSRSKGRGQASSSQMQRQLDELEMQEEKDRYETQRQAAPQQNPQQREQLQILNRLKELAQRQQDVNQQLKELQASLQAAQSEEEREELRRRLKRLREQEQQMLSDVDELKQRMDKAADQASVADAKQQLEKTRGEMQRASEAMDKGQTSQALAEGARAQQNLQDAKEDFRKKTANQFTDDLKKLRGEARQLAQKQEQISEQMQNLAQPKRKTLSDASPRDQLGQQLAQQKNSLTNLLEQMKRVSEQAEASEPILSRHLYDTLRKTEQSKTEQQLDMSSEMLKRGFNPQASNASQQARSSLDELRRGVERAAESVLGDDTDSLRQARRELETLAGEAQKEMAQATGEQGNEPQAGSPGQPSTNRLASAQGPQRRAGAAENGEAQQGKASASQSGASQPKQNEGQASANSDQEPSQQSAQAPGEGQGQEKGQGPQPGQQPSQEQQEQQSQKSESQTPGQGQGQGKGEGKQPDQGQQAQGSQKSEQRPEAQGEGKGEGKGQAPGQGQPGGQPGQQAQNAQPGQKPGQGQASQPKSPQAPNPNPQQRGPNPGRLAQRDGRQGTGGAGGELFNGNREKMENSLSTDGGNDPYNGPITGTDYTAWADRLRDVEEMLEDPALRAEVSQVREQARQLRTDYKKHAKDPQWNLVKSKILEPLAEVRQRVADELARRESQDNLVPIDRDPVPTQFTDSVKKYYERLGKGR